MQHLTIGELSGRTGVAASTIRYYERIGLLSPPERHNGRRRYAPDVVHSLALIRLGQSLGFTLSQLTQLASSEWRRNAPGQWPAVFRGRLSEIRATLARLRGAEKLIESALGCGCDDLTACGRLADRLQSGGDG